MAVPKDIKHHLRQGGWVFVDRPKHPLLVGPLADADKLVKVAPPEKLVVFTAEPGILSQHVSEINDLMWDVMEHTHHELWLQVPGARNIPDAVITAPDLVQVHWAQSGTLHEMAYAVSKALLGVSVPTQKQAREQLWAQLENIVSLRPQKEQTPERRRMLLAPDGTVRML